ncbi:hypothetical protein EVAR_85966_1 [Eumeta japonica]|uniref:Nucleic-acid-binding protein from transposon X-element n=1 Tax=Eumeta variegata TaxID=151549 RepID=A0A4C1UKQ3_EUMVA|nr:hypothetical protein EVAR_85966_1 [Eumeta japonica]
MTPPLGNAPQQTPDGAEISAATTIINQENLDRCSKMEDKMEKLLAEVTSTKEMLGQMHVPERLEEIRKVVAKPAPHMMDYAEAAVKSKTMVAFAKTSTVRLGNGHTFIVASKFENHTAEQVITKLCGVVDARETGVAVDRCSRCLGYGHGKRKEVSEKCAHCDGEHIDVTCRARKEGEFPKCINFTKAGSEDTAHGTFSSECGVRAKWDGIARW